jgi:hypothetical protein
LQNAISLIEDFFGKEWLREQGQLLQKPKQFAYKFTHHLKPEPHPIVPLYLKSLETLGLIKSKKQDYFDIPSLKLISFFQNFEKLMKIGIVDMDGKRLASNSEAKFIDKLKSEAEFFQTAYEIQIAVALARKGFSTWFIKESSTKTPDILVIYKNQRFYVECKYQGLTRREELYENVFREFYWRSMRLMFKLGEFYSICIEWLTDPDVNDVIPTLALIEQKIRSKEFGIINSNKAKISLNYLAKSGEEFNGPFDIDIRKYRSDNQHIDIIMPQAHIGIFDGISKYKNPTVIAFRNISYLDDLVSGAINDINKAYSQIPTNGPSILFLENRLSFLDENFNETAKELQSKVERKIGLISRVNRVYLTKSYFSTNKAKKGNQSGFAILRSVESRTIENPSPATPLLKDTLERIQNLKFY